MAITVSTPTDDSVAAALQALKEWQYEGAPMQLHPGDVGWALRFGRTTTAAALRVWSRDGQLLAVGFIDGPNVLRMTIAPDAPQDAELADQVLTDVSDPDRGVLPSGDVSVEAPAGALLHDTFVADGWGYGESWTPLRRELAEPVEDCGIRVEVVDAERVPDRVAVHRAAFEKSTFTAQRWQTMATEPLYSDARCLIGYDHEGTAVAAVTVWSAGRGKPGLIEPMGVHRDHRGHGYGRSITVAAAGALHELGSSSAIVYTPTANVGGVATYVSAGFARRPEMLDLCRTI